MLHEPCAHWRGGGKVAHLQETIAEQRANLTRFWSFETRLIETTVEATTFDLNWAHTSRINPAESATESWRLTLRNGERRPIALVPGPSSGDCMSVVLEVTADTWLDPALAGKVIDWDLWWKKDAQSQAVHSRMSSLHGEDVRFAFEPASRAPVTNGPI